MAVSWRASTTGWIDLGGNSHYFSASEIPPLQHTAAPTSAVIMLDMFEGCNFPQCLNATFMLFSAQKESTLPAGSDAKNFITFFEWFPPWHIILTYHLEVYIRYVYIYKYNIYIYILTFYLTFCLAYTTCEIQVPDVGEGVPNKIWEPTPTVSLLFWDVDHW